MRRRRPRKWRLEAGAAFGTLKINTTACTMCMACTGACPESALMDGGDEPKLRFLERNCVQCGLCVNTCPENALSMVPRMLFTKERRQEIVLNRAEPFHCIRCDKPLGTKQMITSMLSRLAGHSMFKGEGQLKRLQMCADCRVVDMMENKNEMSIMDAHKSMNVAHAERWPFEAPRVLTPEDESRADYYALLGHLLRAAPDDRLAECNSHCAPSRRRRASDADLVVATWRALSRRRRRGDARCNPG